MATDATRTARPAAATPARARCANNLKQIGLAFQMHHDQLGFFPSGGWDWYTPPTYQGSVPVSGPQVNSLSGTLS